MKNDFTLAFNEIVELRALPREVVLEALSQALVSAYKRDANIGDNQRVEAFIDATGQSQILLEKEVVESVHTDQTEVAFEVALEHVPDAQIGDTIMVPVQTGASFGRIAAQTAKQVILQRIREAEREVLYEEFVERTGDLVTGTVQSVTGGAITISLGRAEAIMPRAQQIPGERFRHHEKVRAYVDEVKKNSRGPQIVVSRAHKNMLRRLLEYEVPEIYNGQVEIKNIAREAGHRSKVAVSAVQEGVDPVGACVGMRGVRIQNIVKELNDEKIDVIEWNTDPALFIAKALSPARVSDMLLEEDLDTGRTAMVIVPDDQLSLAIGREGQNARLAAKLTGWRIDIKSVSEAVQVAFERLDEPPLNTLNDEQPELVAEIVRIMEKKQASRPIQPEEFKTLTAFIKLAERKLFDVREAVRDERRQAMDVVREVVPERAFRMEIEVLELDRDINRALSRIDNVGALMLRLLADEEGLARMLKQGGAGEDALEAIRYALDDLVVLRADELEPEPELEIPVEDDPSSEAAAAVELESLPEDVEEPELDTGVAMAEDADALLVDLEPTPKHEHVSPTIAPLDSDDFDEQIFDNELEGDSKDDKQKKSKRKRRQLIFDEERGEIVAKRRRKGSRLRDEWDKYLEED